MKAKEGRGGQRQSLAPLSRERDTALIARKAVRALMPVWMGAEKFSPTGIRSPEPSNP